MQVGDYAESLSSSRNAKQTVTTFSDGSAEAAPPEPDWTPDMLSGFAADKLFMPLGGLGTDRCSPVLNLCATTPGTVCASACTAAAKSSPATVTDLHEADRPFGSRDISSFW